MELVSIIIPVYNTSIKLLERCLKSIINQKYSDFELIIVDDGSNNEVAKWLDKYVLKDSRMTVIHQDNMGVSVARNVGIEKSKGKYLIFVDSDDYIRDDYLTNGIKYIEANNIDIICENNFIDSDVVSDKSNFVILDNLKDKLECLLLNPLKIKDSSLKISQSPWGKIFKRNVIGRIRFLPDLKYGEDALFNCEVFAQCDKVGIVSENWYQYNVNEFSSMMINDITKNRKFIIEHEKLIDEIYIWAKKTNNKEIFNICCRKLINIIDYVYGESLKYSKDRTIKNELKKMLLNNNLRLAVSYLRKNKSICSKKERIMINLCNFKSCNLILLKKHIKNRN